MILVWTDGGGEDIVGVVERVVVSEKDGLDLASGAQADVRQLEGPRREGFPRAEPLAVLDLVVEARAVKAAKDRVDGRLGSGEGNDLAGPGQVFPAVGREDLDVQRLARLDQEVEVGQPLGGIGRIAPDIGDPLGRLENSLVEGKRIFVGGELFVERGRGRDGERLRQSAQKLVLAQDPRKARRSPPCG